MGSKLTQAAITQLSKKAFTSTAERILLSLGVRITARVSIIRLIPLLGLFLTGGINYWVGKTVGKRAVNYYENQFEVTCEESSSIEADYTIFTSTS